MQKGVSGGVETTFWRLYTPFKIQSGLNLVETNLRVKILDLDISVTMKSSQLTNA